jgi:5'-deoxynucleotidase YfbR-like HD superfamily hydrolase
MTQRESVLEHIGFAASFAFFIARQMQEKIQERIDVEKLLIRAVVHDMDEAILGDVSRTTKYYKPEVKELFSKIEKESVVNLSKFIGVDFIHEWDNAKKHGIEGKILKLTDLAAVVYIVWREVVLLGNLSMLRVAEEVTKFISDFSAHMYPAKSAGEGFLLMIVIELGEINDLAVKRHQDLLKGNRDMLFSFPTFGEPK